MVSADLVELAQDCVAIAAAATAVITGHTQAVRFLCVRAYARELSSESKEVLTRVKLRA